MNVNVHHIWDIIVSVAICFILKEMSLRFLKRKEGRGLVCSFSFFLILNLLYGQSQCPQKPGVSNILGKMLQSNNVHII